MLHDSALAFNHNTNTHLHVLKLMWRECCSVSGGEELQGMQGCNARLELQTELTGIVRKLSERPAEGDELVSDGFIEKAAGANSLSQQDSTTHTHNTWKQTYHYTLFTILLLKVSFFPLTSSGTKCIQQEGTHTYRECIKRYVYIDWGRTSG